MPTFINENIVRIQIPMRNTPLMKMHRRTPDTEENTLALLNGESFYRNDGKRVQLLRVSVQVIDTQWRNRLFTSDP